GGANPAEARSHRDHAHDQQYDDPAKRALAEREDNAQQVRERPEDDADVAEVAEVALADQIADKEQGGAEQASPRSHAPEQAREVIHVVAPPTQLRITNSSHAAVPLTVR